MHPLHQTMKVGFVPYLRCAEGMRVLIHLPIAKNPEDQPIMQWGLVRGTVQRKDGDEFTNKEEFLKAAPEDIEPHEQGALRELEEEAGVTKSDLRIKTQHDHGLIPYHSQKKGAYPVHFYSAELKADRLDAFRSHAKDCQDLAFATIDEIKAMAEASPARFKSGYIRILEQIEREISPNQNISKAVLAPQPHILGR